jgi:hypothetical protein
VTVPNSRTDVYFAYIETLKLNAEGTVWMIGDFVGLLCSSFAPACLFGISCFVVKYNAVVSLSHILCNLGGGGGGTKQKKFLCTVGFELYKINCAKGSGVCFINMKEVEL